MVDTPLSRARAAAQSPELVHSDELQQRVVREAARKEREYRILLNLGRLVFLVAFLAFWEFGSGRLFDPFFASKPTAVARALYTGIAEDNILLHLQLTVLEAVSGYVIGVVVALLSALIIASTGRFYELLEPFIVAIYGIPRTALAPLFIMWFGIGLTPKIIIAAFMVYFVVFMNTVSGIRGTNRNFIDISRLMGANRWQLLKNVILPSAVPYILTALRIVVPTAMIGAIVGEFISSQRGLGFYISRATFMLDVASAFAGILLLLIVILVMNESVSLLERRLMRWHQTDQSRIGG